MADSEWWVYILKTQRDRLYTGITTDIDRRFAEHQSGRGARFTRSDPPLAIVYREPAEDRSSASQREAAIKALTRAQKLELIHA